MKTSLTFFNKVNILAVNWFDVCRHSLHFKIDFKASHNLFVETPMPASTSASERVIATEQKSKWRLCRPFCMTKLKLKNYFEVFLVLVLLVSFSGDKTNNCWINRQKNERTRSDDNRSAGLRQVEQNKYVVLPKTLFSLTLKVLLCFYILHPCGQKNEVILLLQ